MSTLTIEQQATDAEAAAEAAHAKAHDLEAAIVAGDKKITIAQLEEQERAARVADLNARAAVARIADVHEAARNERLDRIRAEITSVGRVDLTGLLRTVEAAAAAFTAAVLTHNDNVARWRSELLANECTPINNPYSVTPEDRGLAPSAGVFPLSVYIDDDQLVLIYSPADLLEEAVRRAVEDRPGDVYADLDSMLARKQD